MVVQNAISCSYMREIAIQNGVSAMLYTITGNSASMARGPRFAFVRRQPSAVDSRTPNPSGSSGAAL